MYQLLSMLGIYSPSTQLTSHRQIFDQLFISLQQVCGLQKELAANDWRQVVVIILI